MCNGIVLVDKIDILTKELGISRKDFANQLDINPSTIATWRTRNILPPMETIEAIADYFKVSIEWLVTEDSTSKLFDSQRVKASRNAIRDRIYDIANSKAPEIFETKEELHNYFFDDMPDFTFKFFYNWSEGRININEYVFEEIAFRIGVSLEYLITGKVANEIPRYLITKEPKEKILLNKARLYEDELLCISQLTGTRKQLASDMLHELANHEQLVNEKNRKKYE